MDTETLRAFVSVAASGSFSRAAEQLYLTQPAISKRIAALEQSLDVRLFDRLGRKVLLTEAGRTLLPHARRILAEIEDSRRALGNLDGRIGGRLVLATSHHIGLHRLPPLLRNYTARHPGVRLDMRFTDSELACDMVLRGDVELAIVTLPTTSPNLLICRPVWDDPLVVCVGPDHPLAGRDRVTAGQLADHPAILPGSITFTRRIVDRFFEARGLRLQEAFATNYLETIKVMVTVGLGWSVLPRTMLDGELRALEVADFELHRALGTVHHTGHTLSNAARAMLDLLDSACAGAASG
jgi:DNA-binding transcriptional LysR family regulator